MDQELKNKIRNEIIYLRSHTKQEVKQLYYAKKNVKEQNDTEIDEELNALLKKKEEYDLIPEEQIEEYINQLYIFYDNQQKILKKIEQVNFSNNGLDTEEVSEAVVNVQEMNDLDYAKSKMRKKVLKELSDLFTTLFNPLKENKYSDDVSYPPFILMFGGLGVSFMYLSSLLLSKLINEPYPEQNYEALTGLLLIFCGIHAAFSIPYIIGALRNIISDLKEYKSQKKQNPDSTKLLNELGIYDIVLEQASATMKLDEIKNRGMVK